MKRLVENQSSGLLIPSTLAILDAQPRAIWSLTD